MSAVHATNPTMSEEQAVHLVRNSLLVAGSEMGAEGDHWPVIKTTIHSIMRDWESLQIERNVEAELKTHYNAMISNLERNLHLCPIDLQPAAIKMIGEMRQLYQARFEPAEMTMYVNCDADIPIHIKRMNEIVKTLENDYV